MITLVLGGTRSGKSAVAEAIAASVGAPVTYVATAAAAAGDLDHQARIEAHRARRPTSWTTVECRNPGDLPRVLATVDTAALVDSLGTWVSMHSHLEVPVSALVDALVARTAPTVIVSEEVGMAVHPPTDVGRRFVDELGTLNRAVAAVADRALLVVAGRTLELHAPHPGEPSC